MCLLLFIQETVEKIIVKAKLQLEADLMRQKREFTDLTSSPVELIPLALPGCRMMSTTCANCHHRGHRKEGNKKGSHCQFEPCLGFHYCGQEKLHSEFKVQKREVIHIEVDMKIQNNCSCLLCGFIQAIAAIA